MNTTLRPSKKQIERERNRSAAAILAGWHQSPVTVLTRDQVARAGRVPNAPCYVMASLTTTGICATEGFPASGQAHAVIYPELYAAYAVALNEGNPQIYASQVNRLRYFLSQPKIRARLVPSANKPLVTKPEKEIACIHGDGTIEYEDGTIERKVLSTARKPNNKIAA